MSRVRSPAGTTTQGLKITDITFLWYLQTVRPSGGSDDNVAMAFPSPEGGVKTVSSIESIDTSENKVLSWHT